ncbi:Benzoate 4-monooxygenase [Mycena venus]|uniref:Benzoate 4-monooxygenase n=1 Tax=Mycena venus TaxID=2733690 RepID=A0A8H6X372_9AGAR|nr:Benzoate 4-monooxygenase [Mycena venus]
MSRQTHLFPAQVLKRLSSGASRNDILGKLIAARGYDALLIAGSDTTSNSMAVTLHFIATNPRVYTKLMGLLLEASSGQNEMSYEQAKNVPYLQATINEGLRLHSTTAIGLHRSAPPGGLTELSVPAWTIGHDSELWGDPDVFLPERWLEGKESRQYLLAFGKGPRACIGQNLAYIEMISVLATILLRYKVEVRSQELQTTALP